MVKKEIKDCSLCRWTYAVNVNGIGCGDNPKSPYKTCGFMNKTYSSFEPRTCGTCTSYDGNRYCRAKKNNISHSDKSAREYVNIGCENFKNNTSRLIDLPKEIIKGCSTCKYDGPNQTCIGITNGFWHAGECTTGYLKWELKTDKKCASCRIHIDGKCSISKEYECLSDGYKFWGKKYPKYKISSDFCNNCYFDDCPKGSPVCSWLTNKCYKFKEFVKPVDAKRTNSCLSTNKHKEWEPRVCNTCVFGYDSYNSSIWCELHSKRMSKSSTDNCKDYKNEKEEKKIATLQETKFKKCLTCGNNEYYGQVRKKNDRINCKIRAGIDCAINGAFHLWIPVNETPVSIGFKELPKLKTKEEIHKEKMSNIKKRIDEVKKSRQKVMDVYYDFNKNIYFDNKFDGKKEYYYLKEDFVDFVMSHTGLDKKALKHRRKELLNYAVPVYQNQRNRILALPLKEWKIFVSYVDLVTKYKEDYDLMKDQKELCKLTNCLRDLEGKNPCEIVCSKCGLEVRIVAKFCPECANRL